MNDSEWPFGLLGPSGSEVGQVTPVGRLGNLCQAEHYRARAFFKSSFRYILCPVPVLLHRSRPAKALWSGGSAISVEEGVGYAGLG